MVTPDPKRGRFDAASRRLREATVAVGVLAALALVVPGDSARILAVLALLILGLVPLVRLAWLGLRWARRGDRRFAWLPAAILGVVAVGFLVSLR